MWAGLTTLSEASVKLSVLESLLMLAKDNGASDAEVFYERSRELTVKAYEGQIEMLTCAKPIGVGMRVFRGGKVGFAYTSDLSESALKEALINALANSQLVDSEEDAGLGDPPDSLPEVDIYSPELESVGIEKKASVALELERLARSKPKIKAVPEASYVDGCREITLLNTKGFQGKYATNFCMISVYAIAEGNGSNQTGYSYMMSRKFHELDVEAVVAEAVSDAVSMLGGGPVNTQQAPCVFRPRVGAMLIGWLGKALVAEAVQKGRSLFAGRVGQKVASPLVTIIDDGMLPEGFNTAPFDGEGTPQRVKYLVESGILRGFMYDNRTARKDKVSSTGNAVRASYRSIPEPAPTNIYLAPGEISPEKIIGQVDHGFYVMEVSGMFTGGANAVSGDFSLGATGRWISNGSLCEPVREVTIAGNMLQLLRDIDAVGNDLRYSPIGGFAGAPTVRVSKLTIAGK